MKVSGTQKGLKLFLSATCLALLQLQGNSLENLLSKASVLSETNNLNSQDAYKIIGVQSDWVEDPGSVPEIDPAVYNKDIFEDDLERSSLYYASSVDKFMSDIQPSDMLTVELEGGKGSHQNFYINVTSYPSKLKVAYSITSPEPVPINFKVFANNPKNEIIFLHQKNEAIFELNIHSEKQFGRYGIQFLNLAASHTQDITFAYKLQTSFLSPYKLIKKERTQQREIQEEGYEDIINAEPLSEEARLFKVLEQVNQDMGHFMTENKFQNFRMEGYVRTMEKSTSSSIYTSVLEILIMVGLGVLQVYHLKRVLDNKRII